MDPYKESKKQNPSCGYKILKEHNWKQEGIEL
jgi:hypothetical protein